MAESKSIDDIIPWAPKNAEEAEIVWDYLNLRPQTGQEWVLVRKLRDDGDGEKTMGYTLQSAKKDGLKFLTRTTAADQYAKFFGEQPPGFMQI